MNKKYGWLLVLAVVALFSVAACGDDDMSCEEVCDKGAKCDGDWDAEDKAGCLSTCAQMPQEVVNCVGGLSCDASQADTMACMEKAPLTEDCKKGAKNVMACYEQYGIDPGMDENTFARGCSMGMSKEDQKCIASIGDDCEKMDDCDI